MSDKPEYPQYGFSGVDPDETKLTQNVGLDPFGAALADHISGGEPTDPDLEDVLDAELEGLLLESDGEGLEDVTVVDGGVVIGPEGVIGIDPFVTEEE